MKINLMRILVFIILLTGTNNMHAVCSNPEYEIEDYCVDANCYITSDFTYQVPDPFPTILDSTWKQNKGNFKNFIRDILKDDYEDLYAGYDFEIEDFCDDEDESDSGNCYDKDFDDLEELLDYSNEFSIYDGSFTKYKDGKDFFLSEYSSVMTILDVIMRGSANGPYKLSDIHPNIINYEYDNSDHHRFKLRNVCTSSSCNDSDIQWKKLSSTDSIKFLIGVKNTTASLGTQTGVDILEDDFEFTKPSFKAGSDTNVTFYFEQHLPDSGCSATMPYSYEITYKFDGDPTEYYYMDDDFLIDYSGTISGEEGALVTSNMTGNKVKITIEEKLGLNKTGSATFYLTVTDYLGNSEKEQMNISPIDVLPGNPVITDSYVEFIGYDPVAFNYYPGDTFTARVRLFDEYGNKYYDFVNGMGIDHLHAKIYSDDSSSYITPWVNGIDSNIGLDPYFEYRFKFDDISYYDLDFNVRVQNRNDFGNYIGGSYTNLNLKYPGKRVFIRGSLRVNDVDLVCTNGNITITSKCISDDFSGCKHSASEVLVFTENGATGYIPISDMAFNQKSFAYTIDHIDNIAPHIVSYINLPPSNSKATADPLLIDLFDTTTNTCKADDVLNYWVYINGNLVDNGTINGNEAILSIPDILKVAGTKNLAIYLRDAFGNSSGPFTETFTIHPDDSILLSSEVTLNTPLNSVYANFDSTYDYTLTLKDQFGNPLYGKTLLSMKQEGATNNLKTNMVDFTGTDAIVEVNHLGPSNIDGEINFSLKSYAPGIFDETFKFVYHKWDSNYSEIIDTHEEIVTSSNGTNSFLQPHIGYIDVSNEDNFSWDAKPEVGTMLDYRVKLSNDGSADYITGKVLNLTGATRLEVPGHLLEDLLVTDTSFEEFSSYVHMKFRIDASSNILVEPIVSVKGLELKYNLDGEEVRYTLNDISTSGDHKDTLGLEIVGLAQGVGKMASTGHSSNFTSIYKSGMKSKIKKNIYSLISGITSGQTINGIRYINGDYSISDAAIDYETLVVENGNLTIDQNINATVGIIVIGKMADTNSGNIYINSDVSYIDAIIYADGSLISSNDSGVPFLGDSDVRTAELQNQLILKGSLFSSNTIGGAIIGPEGYYLGPLNEQIISFNEAMIFDLNYLRRGNDGCEDINPNDGVCDKYSSYFIIEYNPKNNLNPPKGFSISGF